MHAKGTVPGPHARTSAPTARGQRTSTARPGGGKAGEDQRLTPDAPHNGEGSPPPPGTTSRHPRGTQPAAGHARQRDSSGPHARTPAPTARGHGPRLPALKRATGRGPAPDLRRPSQRRKKPPLGMPFRNPHSAQRRFARAHAVGPVLGPHNHTTRALGTWTTGPRCPPPGTAGRERESA